MICSRCIYDDSIPFIEFDKDGICNYCKEYDQLDKEYPTGNKGWNILQNITNKIKKESKNKKYDVVVGVSGGCDSSYLLHMCKELGLRVLAAHFDNTWNSKIAIENIYKIIKPLKIDLYSDVCDNNEYDDIFRSCLLASIPESDLATDIGLATTHYRACEKFGIKYIFEGHSFRTEGITPHGWVYMDARYRDSVHQKFGKLKNINTIPNLYITKWFKWILINKIKKIRPLYYIDYDKEYVKRFLKDTYDWQWYGGHHMENRSSYFANNYYCPKKFGIDLRYCEYSGLIRSKKLSREEALEKIKKPEIFDQKILSEIKVRLNFSDLEFKNIMNSSKKSYKNYKTYKKLFEILKPLFWIMYKLQLVPKSFYSKFTRKYEK